MSNSMKRYPWTELPIQSKVIEQTHRLANPDNRIILIDQGTYNHNKV